jgi:hypothetical protein
MVGMPNILIFQITAAAVFAAGRSDDDICPVWRHNPKKILIYYVAFRAGRFSGRHHRLPVWKRKDIQEACIYYSATFHLAAADVLCAVSNRSARALKGELSGWGVLKRTGNVSIKKEDLESEEANAGAK